MENELVVKKFERMGARAKIRAGASLGVDIRRDRRGEYFDIACDAAREELHVLDLQPGLRHLLLMVRGSSDAGAAKVRLLCGHDERSWFAASVPESSGASSVKDAFEALKPAEVRRAQEHSGLNGRQRGRRRNRAFKRQGEWFFVPAPELKVPPALVIRDEPLQRGGGKPHRAEFCYRTGGETVYVSHLFPNGISGAEYRNWSRGHNNPRVRWTTMRRDAGVYVRGRIRHPDHATVVLQGWHRVMPNTENRSAARRNLVFLD